MCNVSWLGSLNLLWLAACLQVQVRVEVKVKVERKVEVVVEAHKYGEPRKLGPPRTVASYIHHGARYRLPWLGSIIIHCFSCSDGST